jgi:hypothetical protein
MKNYRIAHNRPHSDPAKNARPESLNVEPVEKVYLRFLRLGFIVNHIGRLSKIDPENA